MGTFDVIENHGSLDRFSDQEIVVGTWINGKPVYCKFVWLANYIPAWTSGQWKNSVGYVSANIEQLIYVQSYAGAAYLGCIDIVSVSANGYYSVYHPPGFMVNHFGCLFYYTKTTDTPGMTITNTRNLVNFTGTINYSTDEQVVGIWFDGRPVYQKTVMISLISAFAGNWKNNVGFVASNIDFVVSVMSYNTIRQTGCEHFSVDTTTGYYSVFHQSNVNIPHQGATFWYTKSTDLEVASDG